VNIDFQLVLASLRTVTAAGNYTITNESGLIINKASGQATTVTLPPISTISPVAIWIVDGKGDAATNNITVDGRGSDTINGAATYVINANYEAILFVSNGTSWNIASSHQASPIMATGAAVAAGGTAIGNAAALIEGFNRVTGANNAAAVILPVARPGAAVVVKSATSGSILKVFPQVGSTVNGGAANAVYNQANLAIRTFYAHNATAWFTDEETPT
jgi:hypothetical protein